jgi:hypothetical protein
MPKATRAEFDAGRAAQLWVTGEMCVADAVILQVGSRDFPVQRRQEVLCCDTVPGLIKENGNKFVWPEFVKESGCKSAFSICIL